MARIRHKGMNMAVWGLLGLLMFGLAGFGIQSFGGSATTVATVDGRNISANDYSRALDQQIRAFSAQVGKPVTLAEAQAVGLDASVRAQLVTRALLDAEAARSGLSVGDARVQSEVLKIPAFRGLDGGFDRTAYRDALRRVGYTEPEFESVLREDAARGLLQTAIATGAAMPTTFADRIVAYVGETRAATTLVLSDLTLGEPVPTPDDATLRAWYDAHLGDFTRPEAKRITYAWATPAMGAATAAVEESALRAAYQARLSEFVQPERRLVERLAFGTEEQATRAKAQLDAGQTTFEALLGERRLTLADVDLGDVAEGDLGAAGEPVFALSGPGLVGPLPSDLGPALYRMNGILAAQEVTFDAARPQLQEVLGLEAARRAIATRLDALDDLLAGGATLEDLAKENEMEIGQIDYRPGDQKGVAAYSEFRTAADALRTGDFPTLITLEDGGVLTMRLDETVPAAPTPFDEAREQVASAWYADALATRLSAQGDALQARLAAGETIAALGLPVETSAALRRDSEIATLPAGVVPAAFAMNVGEVRTVPGEGTLTLLRLDAITPPDPAGPDAVALRAAVQQQAEQGLGQDLLEAFTGALQATAGPSPFNQGAVTAVHSGFQR